MYTLTARTAVAVGLVFWSVGMIHDWVTPGDAAPFAVALVNTAYSLVVAGSFYLIGAKHGARPGAR